MTLLELNQLEEADKVLEQARAILRNDPQLRSSYVLDFFSLSSFERKRNCCCWIVLRFIQNHWFHFFFFCSPELSVAIMTADAKLQEKLGNKKKALAIYNKLDKTFQSMVFYFVSMF